MDYSLCDELRFSEKTTVEIFDANKSKELLLQQNGFLKVKIGPDDVRVKPSDRYKTGWLMYFLHRRIKNSAQKLSNLFPAFLLMDMDCPFVGAPSANDEVTNNINELKRLFRSHYLVLPILSMRYVNCRLRIKFVGMDVPAFHRNRPGWTLYTERASIVDAYFYGHWFHSANGRALRKVSADHSRYNYTPYSTNTGKKYVDLYLDNQAALDAQVMETLSYNFGQL